MDKVLTLRRAETFLEESKYLFATKEDVKGKIVNATLLAKNWVNGVYTLSVNGVTATSIQDLTPSSTITSQQLTALQAANITDGGQAVNTIILRANGDVPAMDIPIRICLRGESK